MSSIVDPEVLLEFARQDLAGGALEAAQDKCLRVLSAQQNHPGALGLLGQVLYSQGRHEEAVRVFNALASLQPTVAEHWQNLATALRPTKRYDEAIAAFRRALQLAPPSAALLYNLGILQMERCDYGSAYLALRDAVRLAPQDAPTRAAFAECCYDLVRLDEALAALTDWQQLEGLTDQITAQIALLLVSLGATQLAQPAIDRLLADPLPKGRAPLILASTLERLQRLDEARAILARFEQDGHSLDAEPDELLLRALLAGRAGQHEAAYQHLTAALRNHKEFVHRYHVLFPFAKICDALGRYDEAYAAAEEAHRSQMAFLAAALDRAAADESQIVTRTAHGCDPEDVATWTNEGPAMEESPIFIVGFPRSGTTLLEQALDAHPALRSMDEQPFMLRVLDEVASRGIRYPAELGKVTAQTLDELRARYWSLARQKVELLPGQRLVDKYPVNMTVLPLIRRLFPNARIILAIRHPCDTLLSCFMQDFRSPELALVCRDLATLAKGYARVFEFWYSQWELLRPVSYELRYERFAADFPTEARKLTEFLQLPWNEAVLAPGEHARAKGFISTPSYSQVVKPVNTASVGRWKPYERQFAPVLPDLAPWIERWGYSVS